MKKNFILSGLIATVVNLLVNAGAHFLFLKNVFETQQSASEELHQQLERPSSQLIGWALAVSAITMGFFIATVIKWSGARTFGAGLKKGFIVAFLYWSSVNFGLYASNNHFSLPWVLADLPCSVAAMTIAAAFSAWVMGKEKQVEP
jgi:hypothetical protein